MFGDRMVLMGPENELGSGGGLIGKIAPNTMRNLTGSFAEGTLPQEATDTAEAPEPEATQGTVKTGTSTDAGGNRSQKVVGGGRPEIPDAETPKVGKTPWTAHTTIEGGVSPDVTYGISARNKRIQDANTLKHLTDMRASGATEAQMMQWAQINDSDADIASMIAEEHFPRMQQKVRELQQDVDDARSLKVDPYHWHESIGRGGRVAASFAALTGGFAAGKTNPNSAIKMMETAINKDIAAQEQNIKNEFDALKMQKGLLGDERALFDERLNSMNKIRSVKYAGIVARLQAAKQHAVTEAHHLSLQVAQDHFEVKLLQSIAAAQKEVLRLELDGPLRNGAELAAYKKQIAEFTEQLQPGPAGGITVPTEQVATLQGDTVGGRPEAEIKLANAPGRSAQAASRGTRRGSTSSSGGSGPRGASEAQQTATQPDGTSTAASDGALEMLDPTMVEDHKTGITREETPAETQHRSEVAHAQKTNVRNINSRNAGQVAMQDSDIAVPKHVADAQSIARTILAAKNESVVGVTTWGQAIEDISANKAIRNGGVTGTRDAEVLAALLAKDPPKPSMYIDGVESAGYQMAKARLEFVQKFPEVLERPSSINGERATVVTPGGMTYRVKAGARDPENYAEVRAQVIKKERLSEGLYKMAQNIKKKGISGIFTDEGGLNIPGVNTSDPGSLEKFNLAIEQAMGFIKTHDPTARISDKDLEVGEKAAVPYLGKMDKFFDFVQSMDLNPENNTKRKQIERFIATLLVRTANTLWMEIANEVVPDYNTLQKQHEQAEAIAEFTYVAND